MTLRPVNEGDPEDLWPDALMDELLVNCSPERFDRFENWLKEWSTEEMLQSLPSLQHGVSRDTRNGGLKTVLQGNRIPPKCFASRPLMAA